MDDLKVSDRAGRKQLEEVAARASAQADSENFPVALRLLPRGPRTSLTRVYAFARFVDDVGDEADGDRSELLDLVDQDVRALNNGNATLTPVRGLAEDIARHGIPTGLLHDLVEANRMDQLVSRYETFADLLRYCDLSAAPIGRMVLHIAGAATEANLADSDSVCAALQVLEHCQDVGEDALAGRVYLPAAQLRALGIADDQLCASSTSSPLRGVIANQVTRAHEMLQPGRALVGRLHGWSRLAVAGYVAGGLATVAALRDGDFDVLAHSVSPSKPLTAAHALRLMAGR